MADLTFVEPETVAELISGPQRDDVAVLDVRDDVSAAALQLQTHAA